ncbi:DUF3085 domain-containing protein [Phreatobacter sp. AB_2022a]|uniref:DUF3085 domain-containing protein n=1 Tax=Phreatobacter sp. AB_2022a TaxID=3003134 RepID=UPI002286FCE3|nr:DUF3085 domain-containing protein [Phreatobacter sp. AB_2022a]MCZ0737720.1 DUF3085 domain-containing protein [Phreatobacter sp. AB_2022a]
MFTFSVMAVRTVLLRGRIDAFMNGGFRNPHYGLSPGKDEKPGLWLVGDEGVYIMSNGILAEGQRPLVVYAEECDPKTNPDSWHYKRQHFGGDDGIEFLDAFRLVTLIAASPAATDLMIAMTDDSLSITAIRR